MFSSIVNRARGAASGIASRISGVARRLSAIPRAVIARLGTSRASPG